MNDPQALTFDQLEKPESVLLLGALVVKSLQQRKQITLFLNDQGTVEIADPEECALDGVDEETALSTLLKTQRYNDEALIRFLRNRSTRIDGRKHNVENL